MTVTCTEHGVNTPAYIDSFGGMVPCIVIEIHESCDGTRIGQRDQLTVRVEKTMAGYRKGEIVQCSAAYTPPRSCRFLKGYFYRIRTNYRYVPN